MGEQVFKSAGVFSKEIDLSFTGPAAPFGVGAGVVGTSQKGPAFVPVSLASFKDFIDTFGNVDGKSFGAYAIKEYLRNAQSAVFVRTLGAGDGKKREASASDGSGNTNRVNNAGFVVGGGSTIETSFNGQLDKNRKLEDPSAQIPEAGKGRVYFLGALHSQSAGSTIFQDSDRQEVGTSEAVAIVRGVLFAASGTLLRLSSSAHSVSVVTNRDIMDISGTLDLSNGNFVMVVSGHLNSTSYPATITASMDVSKANYFGNVFNRDPLQVRNHGYMLYESFDISNVLVNLTGVGVVQSSGSLAEIAFLTTGSRAHNRGSSTVPNYENYEDRYSTPISPMVISQKFGGRTEDLFEVEAISDGAYASARYKISIANIKRSTTPETDFGSFSLIVRNFSDQDRDMSILEQFHNLNLDVNSANYICRRIGDKDVSFDFEQVEGSQRLVVDGEYDNVSRLIRIKPSSLLVDAQVNPKALPMGFAGIKHLVTSGSVVLAVPNFGAGNGGGAPSRLQEIMRGAAQPPLPLRKDLNFGTGNKKEADKSLYWGVQFNRPININDLNKGNKRENIAAYTRYFGNENLTGIQPALTASDTFNNNKFTLENIQVVTSSGGGPADPNKLSSWEYVRRGNIVASNGTRSFDPATDLNLNSNVAKFTFILQGGFDGTDIFTSNLKDLTNGAATTEGTISGLQATGPTIGSYRKAIEVITSPDDVDINLLVVPGLTEPLVTDFAIDKTEERFDALYIMDPRILDSNKNVVTSSAQRVSTKETANDHATRGLNTNFAAAYYPDVTLSDPVTNINIEVPASIAALGAFAFNDKVAQPWSAAAGFVRGALPNVIATRVDLNLSDRDDLQNVNINPIATFVGKGAVVFGQKTLVQKQSALDRVNVRRLLIEVRRAVRNVSNLILFEPNRTATLEKFTNLINPILERIRTQAGVERFKVKIDSETTTQADVDNNIIRGKIFIQPTKTIEVIALDFIVTNAGAEF